MVLWAVLLVLVVVPLCVAVAGRLRRTQAPAGHLPRWDVRIGLASMLAYVLAFNLVFLLQEVFLVLPKAFVPGLRPVLYHNNHDWSGSHPLAELFQGTGALATFLFGLACLWRLRRPGGSATARLLLFWLAFAGLFMALPQVVMAAIAPRGDVGRAMTWLGWPPLARTVAALLALVAIPLFALRLLPPLLALAPVEAWRADPRARSAWVLRAASLPALAAVLLIVPFRMPREAIEVVAVPAVITLAGLAWLQAAAWRIDAPAALLGAPGPWRPLPLALWALALLAVFQLLLRPGIALGFG